MKVVLFNTEQEALDFNAAKATEMGCSGATLYWWTMTPYDGQWAVLVGNDLDVEGVVPDNVVEIEVENNNEM